MSIALAILGYGAVTAVGFDAAQTCAAVRAGVSGFRRSGFYLRRPTITPLVGAAAPYATLPRDEDPRQRLARLAGEAVAECVARAGLKPARTALLLGTRERVNADPNDPRQVPGLLGAVAAAAGASFSPLSELLPDGNCATAAGLLRARQLLDSGQVDACVVGGADSYLTQADVERFDRLSRLKWPGNERGFIPGEAAAFVAVGGTGGVRSAVRILGAAVAREDDATTALSDGHPTGRGLRAALAAAAGDAGVDEPAFDFRVADLNGETYGSQDSILAVHRFYRTRRRHHPVVLPAMSLGETGAAAGAVGAVVAAVAIERGYAPGRLAMCEAASDGGWRSGIVVAPAE